MSGRAWRARVFPGHPYGLSAEGTVETLAAIARDDLEGDGARRLIARGALHIAIVGAIDANRAADLIDQIFADLPRQSRTRPGRPAPFAGVGGKEIVDLDVPQSTIRFGRPAPARQDPDYIPSIVLAHSPRRRHRGCPRASFREVREKTRASPISVSASVAAFDHAQLSLWRHDDQERTARSNRWK